MLSTKATAQCSGNSCWRVATGTGPVGFGGIKRSSEKGMIKGFGGSLFCCVGHAGSGASQATCKVHAQIIYAPKPVLCKTCQRIPEPKVHMLTAKQNLTRPWFRV